MNQLVLDVLIGVLFRMVSIQISGGPMCSDRRAVRRELALEDTDRVIGYVGRGHHDKDIPNLFTAVEKANYQRTSRLCLSVLGEI